MAVDGLIRAVEGIRASSEDISRRLVLLEDNISNIDRSTTARLHGLSKADESGFPALSSTMHSRLGGPGSCHNTTIDNGNAAALYVDDGSYHDDSSYLDDGQDTDTGACGIGDDLELLLHESRAYSYGMSRNSQIANHDCHTSIARWSSLSAVSLSQITNLSVLSLPISIHELWNQQHYHSDPSPPLSPDKNDVSIGGVARITRRKTGYRKFSIGQRWLDTLSEARKRERLSAHGTSNSLVHGYHPIPRGLTNFNGPTIKLVLAGM